MHTTDDAPKKPAPSPRGAPPAAPSGVGAESADPAAAVVVRPPARAPRRPADWVPAGPPAPEGEPATGPEEIASYLLGNWRIIQRKDGHRWSLDDFLTAWLARDLLATTPPATILDLGTGIGSVSLMLAWCFPAADVTGVEAQEVSVGLARRSLAHNGLVARMRVVHADLRHWDPDGRRFALVTGTPPYFDDPLQTRSDAIQKGPCRFEDRGGVEEYLAAARRRVTAVGRVVICHASRQRERVLAAVRANGFEVVRALEALPKVGKPALVDVVALALPGAASPAPAPAFETLTVRDADNQWTEQFLAIRLSMGMPPRPR